MAVLFDEVDDYYSIVDDASMSLPDGDWCFGIWTRVDDNTGTSFQYAVSTGTANGTSTINLFLREASVSNGDKWSIIIEDDASFNRQFIVSTATGADGLDRLLVVQRETVAAELQLWWCVAGGTAVKAGSVAESTFGALNPAAYNIGRRADGDSTRYMGSTLSEFFKGNFALTSEEITALGAGLPPPLLGKPLDVYLPFDTAAATVYDMIGSNDATRVDAPTTVEHAPISWPMSYPVISPVAAAGGTQLDPTTATLSVTGGTPSATQQANRSPSFATFTLTGGTPTISIQQNVVLSPATAGLYSRAGHLRPMRPSTPSPPPLRSYGRAVLPASRNRNSPNRPPQHCCWLVGRLRLPKRLQLQLSRRKHPY